MPKTITISQPSAIRAAQPANFVLTAANTDAASVTITAIEVSELTASGAKISQPVFQIPNSPAGVGNPTLLGTSGSLSFSFQVVWHVINMPNTSPNNQLGALPDNPAGDIPATSYFRVSMLTSDGTVTTTFFSAAVQSAVAPFPVPEAGAAQFGQGGCSNLIAVIS